MVRRKELPAVFMPWTVPQIHSVLADPDYLAKFHKDSLGSSRVDLEPWDPPGPGSGIVRKRRCLFTAPLQGPAWFKTMLGSPELVDVMDLHEMMYDPESGCMMVQVDSYMLLGGGATTMRMRHTQWLYRPVNAEDLTGCEVQTTLTTSGASFRNAQLQDLPEQVENALASIATEEATEFNNFALCYIGALQEAGQLPTHVQALSKLMDIGSARPSSDGPKTPGKLADMPFNLVSGVLVHKEHTSPQCMDPPAGCQGAGNVSSTEDSNDLTPLYIPENASIQQQGDMWGKPLAKGERLSMTGSVLEGLPAGGKEADSLLGTKLNFLDLATLGRSLRVKTWRSRAHDSGTSMRPMYGHGSSEDSQQTQFTTARRSSTGTLPTGSDKGSITVEERALLERLSHKHNENKGGIQLRPEERRMVDEILDASKEADELAAEMEPDAVPDMQRSGSHYGDRYDSEEKQHELNPGQPDTEVWVTVGGYDLAGRDSQLDSLRSSSEYSVSSVETISSYAALSPSAIRIWLTPRGGRTLQVMPPPEAERESILHGTTARSRASIYSTQGQRTAHAEWHEQGLAGHSAGLMHQAGTGTGAGAASPIRWTAIASSVEDGAAGLQAQRGDAFSPKSNFSWQPLSDVGRQDENDLFPENLMLTEQSDLGLLRNRLAQVLPKENLAHQLGSRQIPEQPSREEFEVVRGSAEGRILSQPHAFASAGQRFTGAPDCGSEDEDLELMDTSISERSFKPQNTKYQDGAGYMATTTVVETMFFDAEEELEDEGATISAKLLKTLDDAEKHDIHIPEAGVLHTSSSIPLPLTEASDPAAAMANVISVAIETVNAVAETAMTTVNRITRVSLEQLRSVSHPNSLTSHRSVPAPFNASYQGPWEDEKPLSRQQSLATSADARSFRGPTASQVAAFQQKLAAAAQPRPPPQQDTFTGRAAIPEDSPVSLTSGAQRRSFSIEGELQNFRQAGLGRRSAGSAPAFRRTGLGPPGGPLNFQADIAHPNAAVAAGDARLRALAPPVQREQAPFKLAGLGDAHGPAPPFAGRPRVKVPPLWTGSSPFEGRSIDDTITSEAFSEAKDGMQWVNGKGWVEAEKTFLDSFNSAPLLLRRSDSRPSTAPDLAPPGRGPSLMPEHPRVIIKTPPMEAAPIPPGQDTEAVVQRATREHLMAERRRRAARLAARGAPPGATAAVPPPRYLPTPATKADAAARRRAKGGLCGKLANLCGALYGRRPTKAARTISYTEHSRTQVSHQASTT